MTDESPAVAPAPAAAPASPVATTPAAPAAAAPTAPASLFGLQVSHWLGVGVATGGVGALDYLTGLAQPIVHQVITGGAPGPDFEKSLSTVAALVVIAGAGLIANYTRRRAVPAASQNGDTPNAS